MDNLRDFRVQLGRRLSEFRQVREIRFFQDEGSDGFLDPAVGMELETESMPSARLSLVARGVREFRVAFAGRPAEVLGFEIQDLRERQMEGVNWRVFDREDKRIDFLCREIDVKGIESQSPVPEK